MKAVAIPDVFSIQNVAPLLDQVWSLRSNHRLKSNIVSGSRLLHDLLITPSI